MPSCLHLKIERHAAGVVYAHRLGQPSEADVFHRWKALCKDISGVIDALGVVFYGVYMILVEKLAGR